MRQLRSPFCLSRAKVTVRMRVYNRLNQCMTDTTEEVEMGSGSMIQAPCLIARSGQHYVRFDFDPPLGGMRGAHLVFRLPWLRKRAD